MTRLIKIVSLPPKTNWFLQQKANVTGSNAKIGLVFVSIYTTEAIFQNIKMDNIKCEVSTSLSLGKSCYKLRTSRDKVLSQTLLARQNKSHIILPTYCFTYRIVISVLYSRRYITTYIQEATRVLPTDQWERFSISDMLILLMVVKQKIQKLLIE